MPTVHVDTRRRVLAASLVLVSVLVLAAVGARLLV
jgi:hypothetical protein